MDHNIPDIHYRHCFPNNLCTAVLIHQTVSGSLDNHLWKCSGSEMGIIKFPLDNILEKAL